MQSKVLKRNQINNKEKIFELYYQVIEKIVESTAICKQFIYEEKLTDLLIELEKRSQLINIFKSLQLSFEDKNICTDNLKDEIYNFLNKIKRFDNDILNYLSKEKLNAKIEIAKMHKNKESFKGYNLNNTK
ncbi:MAG: hypothetical protein N4A33_09615 [Bacteriovoracaceae bacterium]|jgi:hypothetical protein|nr:hypothetical protein [Bacteriovoracaceae bacterium]